MSICQHGQLVVVPLRYLHFQCGVLLFLLCIRTLAEAIQAAIALEFLAPRNAASMPARFDACGGNARYLFFHLDLTRLKQ